MCYAAAAIYSIQTASRISFFFFLLPWMERESSIGRNQFQQQQLLRRRWAIPILATLLISFLIISAYLFSSSSSSLRLIPSSSFSISQQRLSHSFKTPLFVESKIKPSPILSASNHSIPRLAYLISGSVGDGESLKRTLFALYHPHNTYVVHLDLEASPAERLALVAFVKENPVFDKFQNVRVIVRANLVTYKGPTMVTNTLNAAAILLKEGGDWDWFINLSSSDYPLITQDGTSTPLISFLHYHPRWSKCRQRNSNGQNVLCINFNKFLYYSVCNRHSAYICQLPKAF